MPSRIAWGVAFATAFVLLVNPSGQARPSAQPVIPLPSVGNVTVARLVVTAASTASRSGPRLALASATGVPTRFVGTVVVIRPSAEAAAAGQARSARPLSLRLSTGFSLAEPPRIAKDVLYANSVPPFALIRTGNTSVLAGESPSKLTLDRIVRDAQLLALDRTVPLVDMGVLGLPFVASQFTMSGKTVQTTIVISWLSPVNGIELRFAPGTTVTKITGPPETDSQRIGSAARLIASTGSFSEGQPYVFTIALSRAPRKGEFIMVRASPHYFESSLPFTERFALG